MLAEKQKENMMKMFKKTIEDLTNEKLNFPNPKWKKFTNKLDLTLKFIVLSIDWKDTAGEVFYQFRNGKYKISDEPLTGVKLIIRAPMINVFNYARREMGTLKALLKGLDIKGKSHLSLLLKIGNLLRIVPQKEYDKYIKPTKA